MAPEVDAAPEVNSAPDVNNFGSWCFLTECEITSATRKDHAKEGQCDITDMRPSRAKPPISQFILSLRSDSIDSIGYQWGIQV